MIRRVLEAPSAEIPNASARTASPMWTASVEEIRVKEKSVREARLAKKWAMASSASARSGMSTPLVPVPMPLPMPMPMPLMPVPEPMPVPVQVGAYQVKEDVMETASVTKIVVMAQHACKSVKM